MIRYWYPILPIFDFHKPNWQNTHFDNLCDDMHLSSTRHTFTNVDLSQTTSKSADFTKSEINHKNLKSSLSKTEPEQNKKPHKPPMIPKSLRKSTKRGTMKIPKLPVPSKPKETEIIPYIFERTSVREGTSDWPYLYLRVPKVSTNYN